MPITGICDGKVTTSHTHGICSKMISSKGFNEAKIFLNLTRLQQKGNVKEFTHQLESLATRVFGLTDKHQLETYVGGLKPYIQKELKKHDIANVEATR